MKRKFDLLYEEIQAELISEGLLNHIIHTLKVKKVLLKQLNEMIQKQNLLQNHFKKF